MADKLLSNSSAGQCYSLASQMSEPHSVPSQPFPPSTGKGRPRSSNKKSKAKSPYPFSVESMSSGCQQPSPQVSRLLPNAATMLIPWKAGLMGFFKTHPCKGCRCTRCSFGGWRFILPLGLLDLVIGAPEKGGPKSFYIPQFSPLLVL